jgi:hypothetical protein
MKDDEQIAMHIICLEHFGSMVCKIHMEHNAAYAEVGARCDMTSCKILPKSLYHDRIMKVFKLIVT